MKKQGLVPDSIISSPAKRAMETTSVIIEELKLPLVPQISRKLYPGRIEEILDVVSELDHDLDHLLIVGHNPVFTNLIQEKAEGFNIDWLPTSGLVTIRFKIRGWEYIASATGECIHYVKPKELKEKSKL
jgi:phosphohistidine phosphatase